MAANGNQVDVSIKLTADTKGGDSARKSIEGVGKAAKDAESSGKSSASGLRAAYEGFGKTVNAVGKAVGGFTKALGLIGFAVSAIQTIIEAFRKLNEWIHRNETAAAKLREELEKKSYAESVRLATEEYAKLNAQIEKANAAEREKDAILDARNNKARSVEDAKLNLEEQKELAGVSDDDPDANAKRTLIRNRYAMTRARNAAKRASEDNDSQRNALYKSADQDEEAAEAVREQMKNRLGKNVDSARRKYESALYTSENAMKRSIWTGALVEDEEKRKEATERLPELEKQLEEAIKAYNEAKRKSDDLDESAGKKRKLATELLGADEAARINAAAEQVSISTSNRQTSHEMEKAQAERKRQADENARREQEKRDREAAEQADLEKARRLVASGGTRAESLRARISANDERITSTSFQVAVGSMGANQGASAIEALRKQNAELNQLLANLLKEIEHSKSVIERANERSRNSRGVDSSEGA